ncbi:sensor histidine kinase [Novosphingobium sp. KCTC 2891]|uniref:sensor histidine kinase n=1 Tax=Novosphingobium sp. KCTC 2891 TaxID=2989730 RepID=UPI00222208E0|nr:sensor histidine kinase [Novosphingobium sp. KCTC 2891]MCW1381311.1 sensor histidine kinase [Novosphingobium sp. KCTC 2891]
MYRGAAVRRALTRRRSLVEQVGWILILLAAPTALRALFDRGALGLPFLTYWPSLLIASLILDARFAVVFAWIAAMMSQRLFGGGPWFAEINPVRTAFFVLFALSASLVIAVGASLRGLVRELDQLHLQAEGFNSELRHRVRNMLAIIQALASRGPKAESPLDFYREFSSRLEGLAHASDLLRIGTEAEGRLPELAERTLAPFGFGERIRIQGEPCIIPDASCIPLIMALHELATNAVKHGALSDTKGRIELSWFIASDGRNLYILWKETGGPPVVPPKREGIGTRLLMPQPGLDAVEISFDRKGVWCELMIEGARTVE